MSVSCCLQPSVHSLLVGTLHWPAQLIVTVKCTQYTHHHPTTHSLNRYMKAEGIKSICSMNYIEDE